MANIFRAPLIVYKWPQDPWAWWRTWTWQYNLNLVAKDAFPPGEQSYALSPRWGYDLYPRDLRTYTETLVVIPGAPQAQPPGKRHTDLPPLGTKLPFQIDLRTWVEWYNLTLIGQDRLPVGKDILELAPGAFAPTLERRSWTWSYNLNLISQDALPVGDQSTTRRIPWILTWYREWAVNLLQSTLTPAATPFNQEDWPLPKAPQPLPQSWLLNLQLTTLRPVPFNQSDWPLPQRTVPLGRTWTWSYNINLIAQDAMVTGVQYTDRPPSVLWYRDWSQNLVLTSVVVTTPFSQTDWPVPRGHQQPQRGYATSFNLNLIGQDFLPPGRELTDLAPRGPRPIDQSWLFSFNLNLRGKDRLPAGEQWTALAPERVIWYRDYSESLVLSTLSGQDRLPVGEQWTARPQLGPQQPALSWTFSYNLNLISQDALPVGRELTDRPDSVLWYRTWTQNLLQSTLAPSFEKPFNQEDWPLTPAARQPAYGYTFSFNLNLLGQDALPVGERYTDRPDPVQWRRGWEQNLQQTTLRPMPVGEALFDRPDPVRWYQNWSQNLLQSTLAPSAAVPFVQSDWPSPRGPLLPQRGYATSFNLNLVGQDAFPPGVQRTDLAPRGVSPTDLRSWINFTSLALSASLGEPIGVQVYDLPPRPYPPAPPTITQSYNPNLISQDFFPPGQDYTDRPPPVSWRRGWEFSLPPSILGIQPQPFNETEWPVPRGHLQPDRSYLRSFPLVLRGQDRLPPGSRLYDLSPRGPLPTDYRSFISGNQIAWLPTEVSRTTFRTFIFG